MDSVFINKNEQKRKRSSVNGASHSGLILECTSNCLFTNQKMGHFVSFRWQARFCIRFKYVINLVIIVVSTARRLSLMKSGKTHNAVVQVIVANISNKISQFLQSAKHSLSAYDLILAQNESRTRNDGGRIPRYNMEYVKKGFFYSTLKVWNEIQISIRELPILCQFKKTPKKSFDELKAS